MARARKGLRLRNPLPPGKANRVADALSRKSIGMLMSIETVPMPLQKEITDFNLEMLTGRLASLTL